MTVEEVIASISYLDGQSPWKPSYQGAVGGLTSSAFAVGTSASDDDDRIIYDEATGSIWYDPDGTGAATQVLVATVSVGLALTSADFVLV